jgi:hypothetical protein
VLLLLLAAAAAAATATYSEPHSSKEQTLAAHNRVQTAPTASFASNQQLTHCYSILLLLLL